MSRFSICPRCGKKGKYLCRGYDPTPERGDLYLCRYCNYTERVLDIREGDEAIVMEDEKENEELVTEYKDPRWPKDAKEIKAPGAKEDDNDTNK